MRQQLTLSKTFNQEQSQISENRPEMKTVLTFLLLLTITLSNAAAEGMVKRDVLKTSAGDVEMLFIGHSSLIMTFHGKVIHFDPWGKMADYSKLPKADLVFFTHDHNDHFDLAALRSIQKRDTIVVLPPIFGFLVDQTGSYRVAWVALAAAILAAVAVLPWVKEERG